MLNKYLLCAIDPFSKNAWFVSLTDKRGITALLMHFKKKYQTGANQIRYGLIKVAKFYNNLFNRFLKINNIEMYSRYNEEKENLLLLKKHQS